jgi:tetratricopeptide (TPR) repeat protein
MFAYYHLGRYYRLAKKDAEAEHYLKPTVPLNDCYMSIYDELGTLYNSQKIYKDAENYLQLAINKDPTYQNYLVNMGNAKYYQKTMTKQ